MNRENKMKKEELIKKWLDNELTAEEHIAFQKLEEYDSFVKLSEKAKLFKGPDFDSSEAYKKLLPVINQKRSFKNINLFRKLKPLIQIAAVLIIGIVIYAVFFVNNITTVDTLASQKTTISLPDASIVALNSLSKLSYNKSTWNEQREVILKGEAFFKVAKGSKFDVQTSYGVVSVLGTQFNVKNRDNYFEVKCFEGIVGVLYKNELIKIPAGKTFRIVNNTSSNDTTELQNPTWVDNFSSFKSVPFAEVIEEFERQYNVKIVTDADTDILFTGTFLHDDKIMALQSITLPFGLNYTIEKNSITLKKVE